MMTQTTGMFLRLSVMVFAIAATSSCPAPTQPPTPDVAERLAKIDPSEIPLAEFGQLPVFITDQTTDGRNLRLRGLVFNPYPETIEGVRLILRILPSANANARELDRFHRETDDSIPSGGRAALRFDVQTMYAGQAGATGLNLQAFAIKRGGKELPPPPDGTQ